MSLEGRDSAPPGENQLLSEPPAQQGRASPTYDRLAPEPQPAVATKLRVPAAPHHLIRRRRLLDLLDLVARRITLLSAPAGSGKTVLLASWIAEGRAPGTACWLSLDVDDNDASRLAADLLAALRSLELEHAQALSGLTAPTGARTDEFLPALVNALDELSAPVLLVLDEVHELSSPQAIAVLDFLARYAPQHFRIVLSGRSDPMLPIERLRVSDALGELRAEQLAFDRAEAGALCRQLGLDLSDEQTDALWRRTEGWAAALCLSALSLQDHPEPAGFLAQLAGTDQPIADYLVSEVLAHVPEDRREFMLRTSIVESIGPELADRLTGLEGSGKPMLASLLHSGAPLQSMPPDHGSPRYRYHSLFRELLRAHLQHAHPDELPYLHRRAAHWYADHDRSLAAIEHAIAGEDWRQAGQLIAERSIELLLACAPAGLEGALRALPAEIAAADPRLATALAGVCMREGKLTEARAHLARARRARSPLREHRDERLDGAIAMVELWYARTCGRIDNAARLSRRVTSLARSCAGGDRARMLAFAHTNLGATQLWSGDPDAAQHELLRGLALANEHDAWAVTLDCLAQLSLVHYLRGELRRAQQLCRQAQELAKRDEARCATSVGQMLFASAVVAYECGEFDVARTCLEAADGPLLAAAPAVRLAADLLQGLILAADGRQSSTIGLLELSVSQAAMADREQQLPQRFEHAAALTRARVLLLAEECEQAEEALSVAGQHDSDDPQLLVLRANLALRRGEPADAIAGLARVTEPAGTAAEQSAVELSRTPSPVMGIHPSVLIEAWLLSALAHDDLGERGACERALERALAAAEREPFRAAFLVDAAGTRRLLERHAGAGTAHPALVDVLLEATGKTPPDGDTLADPLTESEQRVLRYLPTMLSNAEIGAEMYVSRNTVKTHLRSIYRKLDVDSRSHAVERARGLGLLPSGIKRRELPPRRRTQSSR